MTEIAETPLCFHLLARNGQYETINEQIDLLIEQVMALQKPFAETEPLKKLSRAATAFVGAAAEYGKYLQDFK